MTNIFIVTSCIAVESYYILAIGFDYLTGDAGECVYDSIIPIVDVTTFPGYRQLSTGTEDPSSPPINIPDGVVFGDKVVNIAYVSWTTLFFLSLIKLTTLGE